MSTHNIFFCGEIKKIAEKAPYQELCFTFNIKTAPLLRPLLGSTNVGLNSRILLYISMEMLEKHIIIIVL